MKRRHGAYMRDDERDAGLRGLQEREMAGSPSSAAKPPNDCGGHGCGDADCGDCAQASPESARHPEGFEDLADPAWVKALHAMPRIAWKWDALHYVEMRDAKQVSQIGRHRSGFSLQWAYTRSEVEGAAQFGWQIIVATEIAPRVTYYASARGAGAPEYPELVLVGLLVELRNRPAFRASEGRAP